MREIVETSIKIHARDRRETTKRCLTFFIAQKRARVERDKAPSLLSHGDLPRVSRQVQWNDLFIISYIYPRDLFIILHLSEEFSTITVAF